MLKHQWAFGLENRAPSTPVTPCVHTLPLGKVSHFASMGVPHQTGLQPSLWLSILDRHQSQHEYKQPDSSINTKETIRNWFKVLKTTPFVESVFQTTFQKTKFLKNTL